MRLYSTRHTGILSAVILFSAAALVSGGERTCPAVSYSGSFVPPLDAVVEADAIASQNGRFYALPSGRDKDKRPTSMTLFENGHVRFSLKGVRGAPIVSNAGFFMAREHDRSHDRSGGIAFYSPQGKRVAALSYPGCELFGFSQGGRFFGIGGKEFLDIVDCASGSVTRYPRAQAYAVSDDGLMTATVSDQTPGKSRISVYQGVRKGPTRAITSGYVRGIDISPDNRLLAMVDRDVLRVFSLPGLAPVFTDRLSGNNAFVAVAFGADRIWAGVRRQNDAHTVFTGILRTYAYSGRLVSEEEQETVECPIEKLRYNYSSNEFPWPFSPQDQAHRAWNGYLALSNSSNTNSGAYLHQGFDIDVVANAQVLAVADGYCKCVVTLTDQANPSLYWRAAVSEVNRSDTSDGFLYAHLNQSSITVRPGDQVRRGQLIGTLVPWDALTRAAGTPRSHIHLSRIRDHGQTWSYTDDQWRNVCDPVALLRPFGDTVRPEFLNAETNSKFLFSTNDSAGTPRYLHPDSLRGSIDIIVKMTDKIGTSQWEQPAHAIYYQLRDQRTGSIVLPRKCGLCRNFIMPDYTGSQYMTILPPIMYRIDSKCVLHSAWTSTGRYYFHTITNNRGDSTLAGMRKAEALRTTSYPDGYYMVIVELRDCAGNAAVDSQRVYFRNGINVKADPVSLVERAGWFHVRERNGSVSISFDLPYAGKCIARVCDLSGRLVASLSSPSFFRAGPMTFNWNPSTTVAGTYIVTVNGSGYTRAGRFTIKG
ncbi:MAG: M23 family metallopeptidase [Chitinispirillaceae bacterium]|nr:M23 family metallopeptidase [Chitinispirillaceae bacterium]